MAIDELPSFSCSPMPKGSLGHVKIELTLPGEKSLAAQELDVATLMDTDVRAAEDVLKILGGHSANSTEKQQGKLRISFVHNGQSLSVSVPPEDMGRRAPFLVPLLSPELRNGCYL